MRRSIATLRVVGDDLVPEQVSTLLGCPPTTAHKKGEALFDEQTGAERIARIGMWRLKGSNREPENLDGQIEEILGKVTADLERWTALTTRFRVDLFCGLFMGGGNEGLGVSSGSLFALGRRGIELAIDVYGPE
jgi:hypothetical protein